MMPKRNILIDGTTISSQMDGLSQYILNIVSWLDVEKANFTFIVRPNECPIDYLEKFTAKGISIEEVVIAPIGPIRELQFLLFFMKNRRKYDAAFFPSNQFPVFATLPSLYTIHDLIYEQFPEQLGKLSGLKRLFLHWNVKVGLRKANKVIAVSDYTRQEIIKYHGEKHKDKIEVIHEGWEHLSKPLPLTVIQKPWLNYIFYVGNSRGHKNLINLLYAIFKIKDKLPQNYGVLICGNTISLQKKYQELIEKINRQRQIISFTGWVSDEELIDYFSKANAFIFPSLSEGFGIPVLEAFYYQVPTLLSNQGSLPEVAGDSAIYFNPNDKSDIAGKIMDFIKNEDDIAPKLKLKGTERLKKFGWQKASNEILKQLLKI